MKSRIIKFQLVFRGRPAKRWTVVRPDNGLLHLTVERNAGNLSDSGEGLLSSVSQVSL